MGHIDQAAGLSHGLGGFFVANFN